MCRHLAVAHDGNDPTSYSESIALLSRYRYASAMYVGVNEAADLLAVSPRRVRELVHSGQLPGNKISGRWLIDEASLPRSAKVARPMSCRVAWAFIALISGDAPVGVSQPEQSRLSVKQRQLLDAGDTAPQLLRSWLARRARHVSLCAAGTDLPDLLADSRVIPAGVSDPRSGMSAAGEVEAYVSEVDLPDVVAEFQLSPKGKANVLFHVAASAPANPVPIGVLLADLADHDGAREDRRINELLAQR